MILQEYNRKTKRWLQPRTAHFNANCAGQGGRPHLLLNLNGRQLMIRLESEEEVTELLRQAAFVRMNWEESSDA